VNKDNFSSYFLTDANNNQINNTNNNKLSDKVIKFFLLLAVTLSVTFIWLAYRNIR
jgi:hypothetical protein